MGIEPTSAAWKAAALPLSYARTASTLLKSHRPAADPSIVSRNAQQRDSRTAFAESLEPGTELDLNRADGPVVRAIVIAIEGVDVQLRVGAAPLPVGSLATVRVHWRDAAWFVTFIVVDDQDAADGLVTARIGDAFAVDSERWAQRVPVAVAGVMRPERGLAAVIRCESVDASLTGVALRLHDEAPEPGTVVGVVLAGDGDGSIAFRGRVSRTSPLPGGVMAAVELIGISLDDHRRLARLIDKKTAAPPPPRRRRPSP
jgi:PilZ domain